MSKTEQQLIAEGISEILGEVSKDIFSIHIHHDGQKIGEVTPEQFRKHMGIKNAFLQDLVKQYNANQEKEGSTQRASIEFAKELKKK